MSTPPDQPPRRIGLTGSIGAGKSTVARLLREAGLTVLDADAVAREVTENPAVLAEIGARFPGVVQVPGVAQGGALDRAQLAARVFGDPLALAALNGIVHPRVRERMAAAEAAALAAGARAVVQDIPLLLEGGLERHFDEVWVVNAPLETRLERLQARGLGREEALARDARQMPAEEKRRRAGRVIDNSGTADELEGRVRALLREVWGEG